MKNASDKVLDKVRRRRMRGWIEIAVGVVLIAATVALAIWGRGAMGRVLWYAATAVPAIAGFVLLVHGVLQLLDAHADLVKPMQASATRSELSLGFGFRSFVAWRYLMARHHRVSRIVLIFFMCSLFVAFGTSLAERMALTKANPLDFQPELLKGVAQVVTGLKIFAYVLLFFTIVIAGLRYVFSFFTTVPLVGVWIGTGALICVLSVMSGFETDLRQKILGSNAHIQVTRDDGEFTEWRSVKAQIDKLPGVVASSPYAVSEVVIAASGNAMPVIIKGIDPETVGKVTDLVKDIEDGDKQGVLKRLNPIINEEQDLTVTDKPAASGSNVVDPPPTDMPGRGDPIDFSKPKPEVLDPEQPPPVDDPPPMPLPLEDELLDAGTQMSTDAQIVDPPPPDLITTDEPPADYSSDSDVAIHVVDVDQSSMTRRTQTLPGILVGKELVHQTHLYTGEEVRVVSPLSDPANPDATGTPIPFHRDYRVAGTFYTGMYEYDLKYVYVTLDSLTDFLDRGDVVDGIEVRIKDPDDTDRYIGRLQTLLGKHYTVKDWKELNRSLFSALKLEKIAMFLVLGIVILVASFSIVGNLIMVVVEKGREIALLKTLGASDPNVMLIFAIQGLLIGIIGTGLGVGSGLIACYLGQKYGIPLNPDVYYIDRMPVHVDESSVIITATAGVFISMAATFYPALLAARVRPAQGMRH